jgi:hypothetical protein
MTEMIAAAIAAINVVLTLLMKRSRGAIETIVLQYAVCSGGASTAISTG